MDTTWSKILALLLLGGISIIIGFIPLKLGKIFKGSDGLPRHGTVFSSLLCFGGGVLLATTLLHLLPEVKVSSIIQRFNIRIQVFCLLKTNKI